MPIPNVPILAPVVCTALIGSHPRHHGHHYYSAGLPAYIRLRKIKRSSNLATYHHLVHLLLQAFDDGCKTPIAAPRGLVPEPQPQPMRAREPEPPKRVECEPYPTRKESVRSGEWVFGFYLLPERLMELARRAWPKQLADKNEPTLELNGLLLMQRSATSAH